MNPPRSMLFANFIGSARQDFLASRLLVVLGILGSALFGATPFNDGLLAAEKPLSATDDERTLYFAR